MMREDPGGDFKDEVRSFFGCGTMLQEMYCAPSLLQPRDWDWIAEGAKWCPMSPKRLMGPFRIYINS